MKDLLLATALLLTVLGSVGSAQKASDLQDKYGPPDAKGRYLVRIDIGIEVEVSEGGKLSKILIKRLDAQEPISTETLMPTDVVTEILAEVVPLGKRGKLTGTGSFAFGCMEMEVSHYEQVTIIINTRCKAQGGGAYDAVAYWK